MRMPILLTGHTMVPADVVRPQSMQISMRAEGLSTASMVLDNDNPDVEIGDWFQIWAPNGEMCVMYAKNINRDYVTGLRTVQMEHTFGLLAGMIIFGEITAATMAGTAGAETCTVYQAISYLLGQQTESLWQMLQADCDFTDAQGWKFTNSDILSDLNSLTDAILDCQWEYDQTSLPWKLKLKAWPTAASMEMRRNRNLETLKVTYDRSGMYTRVYPTGKNNLHINSVNSNVSYLDDSTAQTRYGVLANVITDSTIGSAALLKAWAQKQLARNSQPKISVSISGYELSQATGEDMDHLLTGRVCRIPLPEYGETVNERLTELSWKDVVTQPEAVTCTLANELKTITGVLNEKARGGGGGSKKANTEHDCELGEDEEKIQTFENADIWVNRESIWAVCGCYDVITTASGTELRMKDGTALTITRDGSTWGIYDAGNLTAGIIVGKVNGQTGTYIKIQADKIDLSGYVTTSMMESAFQDIQQATIGQLTVSNYMTLLGHNAEWKSYSARHVSLSGSSYICVASSSGGQPYATTTGRIVTGYQDTTINYIGY